MALPTRTVLAQAGDDEEIEAPTAPVDFAGGARGGAPPPSPRRSFFGLTLPQGYRLAPIGWRGSISDEFDQQTGETSVSRSHRQTLSLFANTFVLHPAVLSLAGNVNWSTGKSGVKDGVQSRDTNATGGISASALSRTNYPFTLSYDVSDSQIDSIQATSRFRRNAARYQQSWRPAGGSYTASGTAGQSNTRGIDGKASASDLGLGLNAGVGDGHALSFNTAYQSSTAVSRRRTDDFTAYFSHGFALEDYYRVSNTARYGEASASALVVDGQLSPATEFRDAQVFNNVMWIPSDDYPLVLNSGLSASWSERDGVAATGVGASLSANYPFSEKLSGSAGISASQSQSDLLTTRLTALTANLTYVGDDREFGEYRHGWGASAGAGAVRATGSDGRSVSAAVSQSLGRAFTLADEDSLMLMLTQSLSLTRTNTSNSAPRDTPTVPPAATPVAAEATQTTRFLSHSADLTYAARGTGDDFRGGLRLQDLRSFDDVAGDTLVQSASITADGSKTISRYSALTASLGFGMSRSVRTDLPDQLGEAGWQRSGAGTVGYRLQQPFGWRLASYEANARLNLRNDRRLVDNVEQNPYLYAYSLDHSLTARVGLLSARLRNDYSWSETGELVWGVSFRVSRDF